MATDFELLNEPFALHHVGNRTESTAMLAWFLENVWREEPDEIEDALCDGSNDKGIDAILIDSDAREVTVFQAKRRRSENRNQGENDLKQFRGDAPYFRGPDGIDDLLAADPNEELRALVERLALRDLLLEEEPWDVRFVFVTNANLDPTAERYLEANREEVPPLDVWTRGELVAVAKRTQTPGLLPGEYSIAPSSEVLAQDLSGDIRMAVALVPANELIARLPGINDLTLFALNVRLGLGRTKINRELADTIRDEQTDHALFPAFHNGITVLTDGFAVDEEALQLDGVSVVNGCQSLLALSRNRDELTPELSVLVKVVQLGESDALADTITYRSNNQNPVNIRDQRANDPIQRDLQAEVSEKYGDRLFFAIRRGEQHPDGVDVLENQDAAQLIMAIWLEQPWAAVRKLKLFDEEYRRIFGRAINADRLYLAHRINQLVAARREELEPSLAVSFASVRWTTVYLTATVARENEQGAALFEDPSRWLPDKEDEVLEQLGELMDHVVTELNNYAKSKKEARENDPDLPVFDPKTAFKSRQDIRAMEHQILALTQALARRIDDFLFTVEPAREA